ncbi:MAG TPA: TetR/AcrR family transcriptional regulator [Candidatus Kapabacteria bacterium]|nr:TetR/AcrR family transcriptional regulator [Candidatus Kapabacteria bacterium]
MNTLTRRQREFLQREQLFLDAARQILRSDGVAAFTIDRIASNTEYAKGTVYKHFTCKEDILCALCHESLVHLGEAFSKALTFPGNSRERMMALGTAYLQFTSRFPEEFDILIAVRTNNVRQKASEKRVEAMIAADQGAHDVMRSVMGAAIAAGDLTLPPATSLDEACFGLWAMAFGLLALAPASDMIDALQLPSVPAIMVNQLNLLLDGYGWRPLSTEFDYRQTFTRLLNHMETTK